MMPKQPKTAGQVTPADVYWHPAYYLNGPGSPAAEVSKCGHGYGITDSCPCCP